MTLFVVDARAGVTAVDQSIARWLRTKRNEEQKDKPEE